MWASQIKVEGAGCTVQLGVGAITRRKPQEAAENGMKRQQTLHNAVLEKCAGSILYPFGLTQPPVGPAGRAVQTGRPLATTWLLVLLPELAELTFQVGQPPPAVAGWQHAGRRDPPALFVPDQGLTGHANDLRHLGGGQ